MNDLYPWAAPWTLEQLTPTEFDAMLRRCDAKRKAERPASKGRRG